MSLKIVKGLDYSKPSLLEQTLALNNFSLPFFGVTGSNNGCPIGFIGVTGGTGATGVNGSTRCVFVGCPQGYTGTTGCRLIPTTPVIPETPCPSCDLTECYNQNKSLGIGLGVTVAILLIIIIILIVILIKRRS